MGLWGPLGTKHYVAALLLVTVGAAGLAVWSWVLEPSEAARGAAGLPRYLCGQCGKEFALEPKEYVRQAPDPDIIQKDRTAARRPHCPLCGARHSGWMMVTCPNCGASYPPPGARPGAAAQGEDVCPRCKTDRSQWYRSPRGR